MSWLKWLRSRELFTIGSDEAVSVAVDRMADQGVGALVVVDGERLVGIFSERDVLRRVLAERRDPETTRVGEVCTADTKTVREDSTISQCVDLIKEHGFRHLPVVDSAGVPVGMISSRDFLRFAMDELEGLIEKFYTEQRTEELTDPYSLVG